jgi:GNAT superfamily N-acetyltransferase
MRGVIAKEPGECGVSDLVDIDHEEQEREPEQNLAKNRDHDRNPTVCEMADIRIVRAARKDLEDVIPLFDEYREFYEADSDHGAARAFLTERTERNESVIFVAYAKPREPVGFTQLCPSFSSVSLKRLWILNDLFVRSDVRRGGVARALLERARQHAIETGAKGLLLSTGLTNKPAQTLYESNGWRREDEFLQYYLFL